ncbi:DUF6497 family protein [Solirhodobacter olei]|uniref:DUF6497 family protein n=1 Tax=Solirhodobacter olei TaxID=2493082 RepID=UPI000FD8FBF5|nr:DUF6497 family protein [Solirhodobacter olei]
MRLPRPALLVPGLVALAPLALAAATALPKLPSGLQVSLMQVVWPAPGAAKGDRVARFRFLAPDLKKGADTDADLKTLCEKVARPMVKAKGATVDQVIVSLASKPLKLGESRPDVVQVFEAYQLKASHCAFAPPW